MKLVCFDFCDRFRCLAGSCPDTCCQGWEIVIDPETLARYRALPGELGERLRAAIHTENGESWFALEDGHCPLLSPERLCGVHLALGEEGLCGTCREHPRFIEEYGQTKELTLSVSCPAAARLLLRREPVRLVSRETGEPADNFCTLDPSLYFTLLHARAAAISLVQDRSLPLADRLALLLWGSVRLQHQLDESRYDRAALLAKRLDDPGFRARQLARIARDRLRQGSFFPCWMLLNSMEHLTKRFPALLDKAVFSAASCAPFDERFSCQMENLAVYFLFRYFLKAVNDGRLLERVESCLFHLLCIRSLCTACKMETEEELQALVSLYSKEVEHSDENLLLLERVFSRGTLSWRYLLSLIDP